MREIGMTGDGALIDMLGSQFIPNNAIGISELIKNSYDADSTRVLIDFGSAFEDDPDDRKLSIRDNGHGMNETDIEKKFMVIASKHKKHNKISPKGRYCTGEMGLGRFALQRLGSRVTVYTKKSDDKELKLYIDWDKYVSDSDFAAVKHQLYDDHDDKKFKENQSGTHIIIEKMKMEMGGNNLQKMHKAIGNLVSPFDKALDFDIKIEGLTGKKKRWEEFDISKICKEAHYGIKGQLKDGWIYWMYSCKNPWSESYGRDEQGRWSVKDLYSKLPGDHKFKDILTDIRFHAYAFVRNNKLLGQIKTSSGNFSKNQLDEHTGVRVYRDQHRVYPYGERLSETQVNDWLSLDKSRMSGSTKWFSNDQIVAAVAFKGEENPLLSDTAARSGMIENDQFAELVTLSRAFMMAFKTRLANKDHTAEEPRKDNCVLCNSHPCICEAPQTAPAPTPAPTPVPAPKPAAPTTTHPTPSTTTFDSDDMVSPDPPADDDGVTARIRGVIGDLENLGNSRGSMSDKDLSGKIKELGQELVDLSDEIADQGD